MDPVQMVFFSRPLGPRMRRARAVVVDDGVLELLPMVAEELPVVGERLELNFFEGRQFVRQWARVRLLGAGRSFVVGLETAAESAEHRVCFRVRVPKGEWTAVLDDEQRGGLADVSAEGFAMRTTAHLHEGDRLHIRLHGAGHPIEGWVVVRSVCELDDGSRRVGVCVEDTRTRLCDELGVISAELQRQALATKAGVD